MSFCCVKVRAHRRCRGSITCHFGLRFGPRGEHFGPRGEHVVIGGHERDALDGDAEKQKNDEKRGDQLAARARKHGESDRFRGWFFGHNAFL